jgi:hypothetical protein
MSNNILIWGTFALGWILGVFSLEGEKLIDKVITKWQKNLRQQQNI